MTQIAVIPVNVSGDIGQQGVSRFHIARQDAATITAGDVTAAGAAIRPLFFTAASWIPSTIIWNFPGPIPVIESTSAIIQAYLGYTTAPLNVTGTVAGNYGAGLGARINWKTTTLSGRRFIKAANYMVPLAGAAYTAQGALSATLLTNMNGACQTMLSALATANLQLVGYHRPAKGASVGGAYGPVVSGAIGLTPASLRSRRS